MNLNAAEAVPDADLTATRPVALDGRGGEDVLDARPGLAGFEGPLPGGRNNGAILGGGGGTDRLLGSDSADILVPGRGRDRVEAGDGRDGVLARDGVRDVIDCGPGEDDFNFVDREDDLQRCEEREFDDFFGEFDRPFGRRRPFR